ncbi:MAG TPA: tetratricopeptide repeat protein [Steroidobacteraceae bacterium]|jgi:Flp pilus assembly protein TadD
MLLLAACGSTPPAPEQAAKSDKAAAKQETPADPHAATAPVEPPVPPEAAQKFEQAVAHMSTDATTAELDMRELADAYPTYSGPLLNLAILQVRAGRLEEAEKSLRTAVDRNGNNAPAFNQLGIVYRKLGRFKEADVAYQRAVEIDPNYAIAYLNLGVLCDLYLQQPERALEAYERYLALAGAPDEKVNGWVTELKKRLGSEPRAARAQ